MKNIFWIILLAAATSHAGATKSKIKIDARLYQTGTAMIEATTVMELEESNMAFGPNPNFIDGSAQARLKFSPNCEYVVTIQLSNYVGRKETKNVNYDINLSAKIEPINKQLPEQDRIKLCGTYDAVSNGNQVMDVNTLSFIYPNSSFGLINFHINQYRLTPISFYLPISQKPGSVIDGKNVFGSKFEIWFGVPTVP